MPAITYENENSELFQNCSWDSALPLEEQEPITPNRMQRAASVAYTIDTRQPEQPLLQFFLPNKVEYFSDSNRDRYSNISAVNIQNANLRRHSSGNCELSNKLTVTPVPPPVPARLNKAPAIPERRNVQKLSLSGLAETVVEQNLRKENGIDPPKAEASFPQIQKLPPPPQSSHSKRSLGNATRNNETARRRDSRVPIEGSERMQRTESQTSNTFVPNGTFQETKTLTPLQNAALLNSLQQKSYEEGYFKFPKVNSTERFSRPATEEAQAYSHIRRESGKKIPPPIRTYASQTIDAALDEGSSNFCDLSKVPERHDSQLSCSDGGISQTSSPSYLVRSLESPLLPKIKNHSTNRHKKRKFITEKLFADINEFAYSEENKVSSLPDLTKSQSTPGGLQTVVDYRQGTNLPYRHKVIKNGMTASCLSKSQLKYHFAHAIINFVIVFAAFAGLAYYLKSHFIQTVYINNTIIHRPNLTSPSYTEHHLSLNEEVADFLCVFLTARFCIVNHVPYNITSISSLLFSSLRDAEAELELYVPITNVRCYELAPLYLCSLYLPKCGENRTPVKPCRNLCQETKRRCGIFFEVFGLQFPIQIDCNQLPASENPNECIGNQEVLLHQKQEENVVCHDGFKCDHIRCIPADWRCDGHIDCKDETDESNCTQCPGQLHCGDGKCIATSHICDGEKNCPWGQDERNCVRLNEKMGDHGYGNVEVFVAEDKAFKTACIRSWDQQNSPKLMCELLGYQNSRFVELQNKSDITQIEYIQYNKESVEENKLRLFHELKSCQNNNNYPIVRAYCQSYACGIRKQFLGPPSKRIVGGLPSVPGDWPFLAAILGGPKEIFYCAGVLISDQWVLSAAHCVGDFNLSHPPDDWTIQLGMTRRSSHSYFGQKLKVIRVIRHPQYNQVIQHDNDIALFQLKEQVTFHDHLLPVCMPKNTTILRASRNCTVIGWGKREDNEVSDYQPTIHEVPVPIVNRSLCNTWLRKQDLSITDGMICAGYEEGGKDACQGDSGGPLLCQYDHDPNKWFVGGIVSWGVKCAHPHLPGIYANVPHFVPWIRKQMELYTEKRKEH